MFEPEFVTRKEPDLVDCHFTCFKCEKPRLVTCRETEFHIWTNGAFVQNAFPNMSADDREMFVSGVCPTCWKEIMETEDINATSIIGDNTQKVFNKDPDEQIDLNDF